MKISDEELYSRFLKEGDSEDLRVLLERHRESLTMFLYRYLHDMEDAEEIMLDSFAVAISGTAGFLGKSSFKTWLFAIGRNLAMREIRKRHISTVPLNDEVLGSYEGNLTEYFRSEDKAALYRALEMINRDYREVLYLMYFEDMSIEEIASVMKKNKKQVYNLIQRGKDSLKSTLERMGFKYENY